MNGSSRRGFSADAHDWTSRLLDLQRKHNEDTRELWDLMSAHRSRVTRETLRGATGGRLTVFGAGNCNDLDLPQLLSTFATIHLLDLDAAAIDAGLKRQGVHSSEGIHRHAGVDFGGLGHALSRDAATVSEFSMDLRDGVRQSLADGPPPADRVVSACVLSQLIEGVATARSRSGDERERAVAVRDEHVDLLLRHTAAGGSALLVTDLVSSDTAPELRTCPDLSLPKLRDELIARHNYFHGTNPYAIEESIARRHRTAVSRVERRPPWRWALGERVYLVVALKIERAREPRSS